MNAEYLIRGKLHWLLGLAATLAIAQIHESVNAQAVVPGTGRQLTQVGDDFEDESWSYDPRLPKVYNNKEETLSRNEPGGVSSNRRFYEGMKRGQPDLVRRIPTPEGGLPGSQGALLIRSLHTGGPRPTGQQQQEDLIGDVAGLVGKLGVVGPQKRPGKPLRLPWVPRSADDGRCAPG